MASKKKEEVYTRDQGYIHLHREIRSHWIWQNAEKLKWWLDILMECNHTPNTVNIGYELFTCERGQSLNSLLTWSTRWRAPLSTVKRFLTLLEKDKMIVIENLKKTTRITVCKYDDYNGERKANETQVKRKWKASETQVETNKNENNDNNENNIISADAPKNILKISLEEKKADMLRRRQEFGKTLEPYQSIYGREMLLDFFTYWGEANKSGTKFLQEMKATWDLAGRLRTWEKNNFSKYKNQTPINGNGISKTDELLKAAARAATGS